MRYARPLLAVLFPLALASCTSSSMPGFLQVYQMDINQGNLVDEKKLAELKPGMTREEVRFLLGSPMLIDIFHKDRWDYVYYNKLGKEKPQQQNLTLIFVNDRLARVELAKQAEAASKMQ